jgi:hypothetical protein
MSIHDLADNVILNDADLSAQGGCRLERAGALLIRSAHASDAGCALGQRISLAGLRAKPLQATSTTIALRN